MVRDREKDTQSETGRDRESFNMFKHVQFFALSLARSLSCSLPHLFSLRSFFRIFFCHMYNAYQTRWKYGRLALRLFAFDRVSATVPITNPCSHTHRHYYCAIYLQTHRTYYIVMHFGDDSGGITGSGRSSNSTSSNSSIDSGKKVLSTDTIALPAAAGSNFGTTQRMDNERSEQQQQRLHTQCRIVIQQQCIGHGILGRFISRYHLAW